MTSFLAFELAVLVPAGLATAALGIWRDRRRTRREDQAIRLANSHQHPAPRQGSAKPNRPETKYPVRGGASPGIGRGT